MGDPTGVGPEILIKSLAKPETYAMCRPLAVGSVSAIERMAGILGSELKVVAAEPESAAYAPRHDRGLRPLGRGSEATCPSSR